MIQREREDSTGFRQRRTQGFVDRSGPFLLAILTITGWALIADLTGHVKHADQSSVPFDPFNRGATSKNLQGGLESQRMFSDLIALNRALSRMSSRENDQTGQREMPLFAQTLYWMYGQEATKGLAVKFARSLNKREFDVIFGSYVPDRGDGVAETDFAVAASAPTPSGEGEPRQELGTTMYIREEAFSGLPLKERVQIIVDQFILMQDQRGQILRLVAGGMNLRKAIDIVQGPQPISK